MNETVMKTCGRCQTEKDIDQFCLDRSQADDHASQCRACRAEAARKWAAANRARSVETTRKWRAANRERVNETHRQWCAKNRESRAETGRKWREANRGHLAEYCAKNRDRRAENHRKWAADNSERRAEYHRQYREANRERAAEYRRQRYTAGKGDAAWRARRLIASAREREARRGVPPGLRLSYSYADAIAAELVDGPWSGRLDLGGTRGGRGEWSPTLSRLDHANPIYAGNFVVEPACVNFARREDGSIHPTTLAVWPRNILRRIQWSPLQPYPVRDAA